LQKSVENIQASFTENNNIEKIISSIALLIHATHQVADSYGLKNDLEKVFLEVHKSNMTKLLSLTPGDKAVRGSGYQEADIESILHTPALHQKLMQI